MPRGATFPPVAFTVMVVVLHDCADCALAGAKYEIKRSEKDAARENIRIVRCSPLLICDVRSTSAVAIAGSLFMLLLHLVLTLSRDLSRCNLELPEPGPRALRRRARLCQLQARGK